MMSRYLLLALLVLPLTACEDDDPAAPANNTRAEYEAFADQHWNVDKFVDDHLCPTLPPTGRTLEMVEECGRSVSGSGGDWWLHYVPWVSKEEDKQYYYENIGKYDWFASGWDDWIPNSASPVTPHRDQYLAMRNGRQAYEIKYETGTASGWFGGDSRPSFTPRTVGNGCSVLVEANIVLESFSFHFERAFYVAPNTGDTGHAVTLMLNIRDATGVILKTVQLDLPGSYSGGWATWTGIDMNVDAGTTLIFTTYLVGAFDTNQVTSGASGDVAAGYAGGVRYTKESTSDAAMEVWTDWNEHPWDTWFWLQGTTR